MAGRSSVPHLDSELDRKFIKIYTCNTVQSSQCDSFVAAIQRADLDTDIQLIAPNQSAKICLSTHSTAPLHPPFTFKLGLLRLNSR